MMDLSENNCRLCLNHFDSENCSSIFLDFPSEVPSLSTKIMVCLSLPIEPKKSFSSKICDNCTEEITRFYDFRDKCLKTYYSLSQDYRASNSPYNSIITDTLSEEIDYECPEVKYEFHDSEDSICSIEEDLADESLEPSQLLAPKSSVESQGPADLQKSHPTTLPQNRIYEYKCLHCRDKFSELKVASLHCMNCPKSPHPRRTTLEVPKNPKSMAPTSGELSENKRTTNVDKPQKATEQQTSPAPSENVSKSPEAKTSDCSECGAKFFNSSLLKRHKLTHTGERPFTCDTCNRTFAQLGQLNFHRKYHLNPRYRCNICEKPFLRPSDIKKHMRVHTGEKPFICQICNKSFAQEIALKQHERVHTGDKPYICEICGKCFSQRANKMKHLKIHKEGTKPHTCGICGRSFSEYKEMLLHRAGHGGGKPRECDHCNERFRKKSQLTDHIRRYHTFERPYQCAFCSKAFYSKYNLKQHVLTHTGQKPFSCSICEVKFTQKGNLAKHNARKHASAEQVPETEKVVENRMGVDDS